MTEYSSDLSTPDTTAHKPRAWKGLVFIIVLLIGAALLALFVLRQRSVEGPLIAHTSPTPLMVETTEVEMLSAFTIDERFTGLVVPRRTSQLGFSVGGRINSVAVDVGDAISEGQTLAALDTRALQAQLQSANALVREAEAAHALALATVERQVTLSQKGHVSQQRVDEAVAQADSSLARIDGARANAQTLRVQIALSRIDAPFAGTVTKRMADEGAIAAPGVPLLELVESGALEARIGLPASLAATLEVGKLYTLTDGEREFPAHLRAKTGVIDMSNRTVTTVLDIDDATSVASGSVVRMALKQTITEPGFWVPVSALTERQRGLWAVFVARPTNNGWTAEPGTVEIVHSEGGRAFVRGAVRQGDLIITDGLHRIAPGQPVRPEQLTQVSAFSDEG